MKKIGFIGVGIMGKSMVRNLMKTGYELHIYARTKAKVDDVISEGAIFHESIKECVPGCDAVREMWKRFTSMKAVFWKMQIREPI